jgi:hypothetical protein
MTPPSSGRAGLCVLLVAALAALHHDFWFWGDRRLVLGFLPAGLAYHVAFSVACAGVWVLVLRWGWPASLEDWADGRQGEPP